MIYFKFTSFWRLLLPRYKSNVFKLWKCSFNGRRTYAHVYGNRRDGRITGKCFFIYMTPENYRCKFCGVWNFCLSDNIKRLSEEYWTQYATPASSPVFIARGRRYRFSAFPTGSWLPVVAPQKTALHRNGGIAYATFRTYYTPHTFAIK